MPAARSSPSAATRPIPASSRQPGIEQVNIANNHYIDFGGSGRESTRAALEAAGIGFSGYTYRSVVEVNGYRIGFAGCRETVYLDRKAPVYNDLQALREAGCDAIIYSFHWGKEYSPTHNQTQRRMADYAIQHGADIVVGTHPHCVQGVEHRRGSLILWSLGNLVFGGTHEMTTFDAVVAQAVLRFEDGEVSGGNAAADAGAHLQRAAGQQLSARMGRRGRITRASWA